MFTHIINTILLLMCSVGLMGCNPDASPPTPPRNSTSTPDVPVVSRSGPLGLGIDRSNVTPLTARGRCIDLLINCHSATDEERDRCVNQLRRCQTSHPWDETASCCPSACIDTYLRERRNGTRPREANIAAFDQRACYPGVEQMIRGEAWR